MNEHDMMKRLKYWHMRFLQLDNIDAKKKKSSNKK